MQSRTSRKPGAVMARYALSAAIAAVLAGPALAQEQDEGARSQQDNQNVTSLDTIVVSGTATSGGVNAGEVVQRSARRYVEWVSGVHDDLT